MIEFLNTSAVTTSTKVSITEHEQQILLNHSVDKGHYKTSNSLLVALGLRQYLRHRLNRTIYQIITIEFRIQKPKIKSIQKRTRIIQQKSSIHLSIRMAKTINPILNHQQLRDLHMYEQRNRI